jgi:hypothetical protein
MESVRFLVQGSLYPTLLNYGNSRMWEDSIMVPYPTFYATLLKLTVFAEVQQSLKKFRNTANLLQHAGWPTFTLISTMEKNNAMRVSYAR